MQHKSTYLILVSDYVHIMLIPYSHTYLTHTLYINTTQDWPENIALQRLPRASASPARHEQITNQSDPPPPQYADVMQNPVSHQ